MATEKSKYSNIELEWRDLTNGATTTKTPNKSNMISNTTK